jgi:hypothetical protein
VLLAISSVGDGEGGLPSDGGEGGSATGDEDFADFGDRGGAPEPTRR